MIDPNELAQSSVSRQNLTGGLAMAAAISVSTAGVAESVFASPHATPTTHSRRKEPAK